jgi:dihydroorotase
VKTIFRNFRLIDSTQDTVGTVLVTDCGTIGAVITDTQAKLPDVYRIFDGGGRLVLSPAFVDMHTHLRDPGFPEKETLESAALAAAAGGFGTLVCMANTKPVIDNLALAQLLKQRSDVLGIIDLYPAMALTHALEGQELSGITESLPDTIRLLSEDGKDIYDDALFLAALQAASRADKMVSCHCEAGGESAAVARAITLGKKAGCRIHIAHVSTQAAVATIRREKSKPDARLSCEISPHHCALTQKDARKLGAETFGLVAPPLRTEDDRRAIKEGLCDGTINVIATDHAPHTSSDKEAGSPGFTGLETAFAVCNTVLVRENHISPQKLSDSMSAEPARLLGFSDRGRLASGLYADLVVLDPEQQRTVNPALFYSRGKNTPFAGRTWYGVVLLTMHRGRIVYES